MFGPPPGIVYDDADGRLVKIYKEFQVLRHRHNDGIALRFIFPAHLGRADGFQPRFGMKEDAIVIVQGFDLFQDLLAFCGGFLIQERAERMGLLQLLGLPSRQDAGTASPSRKAPDGGAAGKAKTERLAKAAEACVSEWSEIVVRHF